MGLFHEFYEQNSIVHDNEAIFNYLSPFEGKVISKQLRFFDEVWLKVILKVTIPRDISTVQNNNSLYLKERAYIFTVDKGNAVEYS